MASHDGQNDRVDCEYSLLSSDRPINYGHFADFDLGAISLITGETREVLRAFGHDKGTEDVNLTLGIEYPDLAIPSKGVEVIAILEWGTGVARQTAEVDWKEGTNLAVPCSIIQVQARVTPLGAVAPGSVITLRANIAWGPGSRTYATRTLRKVTIGGGGTATVSIPKFAARFFPLPANAAGAASAWATSVSPGSDILSFGTVAAAQFSGVEIPGSSKFVELAGAAGAEITLYFLLCL